MCDRETAALLKFDNQQLETSRYQFYLSWLLSAAAFCLHLCRVECVAACELLMSSGKPLFVFQSLNGSVCSGWMNQPLSINSIYAPLCSLINLSCVSVSSCERVWVMFSNSSSVVRNPLFGVIELYVNTASLLIYLSIQDLDICVFSTSSASLFSRGNLYIYFLFKTKNNIYDFPLFSTRSKARQCHALGRECNMFLGWCGR